MTVHNRYACVGHPCPFHAPSAHHMVEWPFYIRATRLVERLCPHGVGHPDPDSLAYFERALADRPGISGIYEALATHGCDGCCIPTIREPVPDAFRRAFE